MSTLEVAIGSFIGGVVALAVADKAVHDFVLWKTKKRAERVRQNRLYDMLNEVPYLVRETSRMRVLIDDLRQELQLIREGR